MNPKHPSARIMPGAYIGQGVLLEENVVVGPNACLLGVDDCLDTDKCAGAIVRAGAIIGANAVVLCGVVVGVKAVVGAGTVVTRSVPAHAIAVGNPARIIGYVGASGESATSDLSVQRVHSAEPTITETGIGGVTLHELPLIKDLRGDLSVGEFKRSVPFIPQRYFLVFDVPSREIRGEHAHRRCHQFLICVKGSCAVVADDGRNRRESILDRPNLGIYLPPMIWGIQYKYSKDTVLLVFASDYYDAGDYIRDYAEFIELISGKEGR